MKKAITDLKAIWKEWGDTPCGAGCSDCPLHLTIVDEDGISKSSCILWVIADIEYPDEDDFLIITPNAVYKIIANRIPRKGEKFLFHGRVVTAQENDHVIIYPILEEV